MGGHHCIPPEDGILTDRGEATIFPPRNDLGIAPITEHERHQWDFWEREAVPGQPQNVLPGLRSETSAMARQQKRTECKEDTTVGAVQHIISAQQQANMHLALSGQTSQHAIQPNISDAW